MANKSLVNKLCMALGVLFSGVPFALLAAPASVTDVQVVKSADFVRVIFTLANPHQCDVFSLFNPSRIVVDLENGRLQANLKQLNLPASVFKSVRSGTPEAGVLRIVFDMAAAAQVKSSINTDNDSRNGKLFVDIYPAAPMAEMPKQKPVMEQIRVEIVEKSQATLLDHFVEKGSVSEAPAPVVMNPPLDRSFKVSAAPPPPEPRKLHAPELNAPKPHQLVVVIDAGHGGKDSAR